MYKKLAKLKYLPNNFEIIENGDHVICAIAIGCRLDEVEVAPSSSFFSSSTVCSAVGGGCGANISSISALGGGGGC